MKFMTNMYMFFLSNVDGFFMISHLQFCEWISTPVMCKWAGPILDLLLEHVGHVQLCSKLTELLDSREEWHAVKRKSCKCQKKNINTCLHPYTEMYLFQSVFHFLTQMCFTNMQMYILFVFCLVLQCRHVHCCTSVD